MNLILKQNNLAPLMEQYRAAFAGALTAFLLKKADKASTKNALKTSITTFFLLAFLTGYRKGSGGSDALGDEDQVWIDVRTAAEIGFMFSLVDQLAGLDTSNMSEADLRALAQARALAYSLTLIAIYNQGLLRGNRNIFLTFGGIDGAESCRTCQRLKGRRKRARWWIDNHLVPGEPGNSNYECKGYRCLHDLMTDDGAVYTATHATED